MDNFNMGDVNSTTKETKSEKTPFTQGIKIALIIIALFSLGNIIGSLTNIQRIDNVATQHQTSATETTVETLPSTTLPTTTQPTTQVTTTTEPTTVTTTAVTTTEDTTPDSKEEIVNIFNKSANKVKKNAKKITRNYENIRHDESISNYPVILKLAYNSLMDSWMVDHDIPIEYVQSAGDSNLIKDNFPVKGKDWSSKLTANDVDNATIREENGNYHITLVLAYCKDPAENTGVCAVMEEVDLAKVQELVDVVKSCETEYYDCKVECIIEKDTGNLIYAKYTQPMMLNLTAGRVRDMKAVFAMSIESEYEIQY